MPQAPDRLFDTPELHCLAFNGDEALFVRMDRESYRRSIFLDHRASTLGAEPTGTAIAPLIAAADKRPTAQTGWIFHVAHCGSTLLSRIIDSPGSGLVLREPPPLRQLGVLAASGDRSDNWVGRLKLACALAGRRFEPSQPTVVKANVPVNFIIPEILQFDPGVPVILLYLPLEPYLLAVLRDVRHRAWVDRVTRLLEPSLATNVGLGPHSDTAERAAALWLAQMLMFDAVLASHASVRSLDAESFFASPGSVAEAAAAHFGLSFSDDARRIDELTSTNAKNSSQSFNNALRLQRQKEDRSLLRDDINSARRWTAQAVASGDLPQSLDRPLAGAAPPLLD